MAVSARLLIGGIGSMTISNRSLGTAQDCVRGEKKADAY